VDRKYQDRMLLAEANQWPDDAVAYFGEGDECHMAFHFPVMPRLFMGIHTEDRFPVVDILEQTPPIPDGAQWAVFLRNHDELTLEMVTDEDRDYMYRVYARDPRARINLGIRRRLAPLMGNNRRKIELMNSLLFSLPGTPILYYGDEIGMGDNIYLGDRNGVRTPMQWSADRNAGFSRSNPQRLFLPVIIDPEYHFEAVNVEAQQHNPQSFLWWMKRLIAQRKRYPVLGTGTIEFLQPENRKVLAFLRESEGERLLVVANLSRFVQCADLDLARFDGSVPVEVFGQTRFPAVTKDPYFLTLAPHTFYWLALEEAAEEAELAPAGTRLAVVTVAGTWEEAIEGTPAERLERGLMRWLPQRRWFGAKARDILGVRIVETVRVEVAKESIYLTLIQVSYTEGDPDVYFVPLGLATAEAAEEQVERGTAVARIRWKDGSEVGVVYDAVTHSGFCRWLLDTLPSRRRLRGRDGAVTTTALKALRDALKQSAPADLEPTLLGLEQSNSSVVFGSTFVMKLFRRLDEGLSPELEVGRFLTTRTAFRHVPAVVGSVEYRRVDQEPLTMGVVHTFVPNEGDAWRYTLDAVDHYFERVLTGTADGGAPVERPGSVLSVDVAEYPPVIGEMVGIYLESARLLGQRTAELHVALGSRDDDPAFAPEPFTGLYQRSLYQSLRSKAELSLTLLGKRVRSLPPDVRGIGEAVLNGRDAIMTRFRTVTQRQLTGMRIRCHGDYHLGQVLYTGRDFVILDFEGEPALSLGQRRLKRSPLVDVAGMLRSFDYAAESALLDGRVRPEDVETLKPWMDEWRYWVSRSFLDAYRETAAPTGLLPRNVEDVRLLLECYQLEKALYEVTYELNHRPSWSRIPLRGIRDLLQGRSGAT
ncbi:MAG: alpha-amylase, partial [Gemmatimonas sp. SG8_28]